jgi:predicted DCC family thiol-disulfide oxidoreductase YuxK
MVEPDRVFFDGGCGLCHRAVLFALRRDPRGHLFRFAPLHGATFARTIPEGRRAILPDSLVVVDAHGGIHTRAAGVIRILRRIDGGWGVAGAFLDALPHTLADLGYRVVAGTRRRFFAPPEGPCPLVPPELRSRFED